jgi:hypothetical protein
MGTIISEQARAILLRARGGNSADPRVVIVGRTPEAFESESRWIVSRASLTLSVLLTARELST